MSTVVDPGGLRSPVTRTPPPGQRTRLSVVPRSRSRRVRVPFALLVVLALAAGVVGLLLVNTSLQQGAFAVATLESRSSVLLARQQSFELAVSAFREPGALARRAQRLGMVPAPRPAFLRLSDGRILGRPARAVPSAPVGAGSSNLSGAR